MTRIDALKAAICEIDELITGERNLDEGSWTYIADMNEVIEQLFEMLEEERSKEQC